MYFTVDVLALINMVINLIILIGLGIWYLWISIEYYFKDKRNEKKKKKKMAKDRECAGEILEKFEELLAQNDIKIPNNDREGEKDEACIFGRDYYDLEDAIVEILEKR